MSDAHDAIELQRRRFWRALAPRRVLVAGAVAYAFILLVAPVSVDWQIVPISFGGVAFVVACIVGFLLGTITAGKQSITTIADYSTVGRESAFALYWIVAGLGILGGVLRVYDRYVVRGLAGAESFLDRSEILGLAQSSAAGIIAGPLFPFLLLVPFAYLVYARNVARNRWLLILSVLCLAAIPIESSLTGSRSSTVLAAGLGILIVASEARITLRRILLAMALCAALVLYAGEIFIERVSEFGSYSVAESAGGGSGYSQTVPTADWVFWFISGVEDSDLSTKFVFSIVHFCQYYIHGVFEFFRLFDEFEEWGPHSWGSYTFPLTYRVLALLFELPTYIGTINPRAGVFSMILGGMYIDFGWMAVVVSFAYGWISQVVWYDAASTNVFLRPLYFLITVAIFFAPVADFTSSSVASYVMTATVLLIVIGRAIRIRIGRVRDLKSDARGGEMVFRK